MIQESNEVVGQLSELPPAARRAAPPRRAFTIVEIVVVISLILFLLGLTLSVSTIVIERSEIRQTENTIRLLDMALQEWEALADRQITWGTDGVPFTTASFDMDGLWEIGYSSTDDIFIVSELLAVIGRSSQVKDIIARIDPDFVHVYVDGEYPQWVPAPLEAIQDSDWVGSVAILDAWDTPIYPTHPGPRWDATLTPFSLDPDEDGTARIYNEIEYGIARNRRICFVSAGPDGHFGTVAEFGLADTEARNKARGDNIYSYQPQAPPEWEAP